MKIYLDVIPDVIEIDKPSTYENNFLHHMAVGEHIVSSMWMNSAAISIEKLLDEILKVNKKKFKKFKKS